MRSLPVFLFMPAIEYLLDGFPHGVAERCTGVGIPDREGPAGDNCGRDNCTKLR